MRKSPFFIICLFLLLFSTPLMAANPEIDYFALYFNGSRCGYAIQSRQINGKKVVSSDTMHLELKRMGTPLKIEVTETAIETLSGRPLGFGLDQKMAMTSMTAKGIIRPDGKMEIKTRNAGNTETMERAYPKGAIMSEGLQRLIRRKGLKPGTTYEADVFSPSAMQAFKMTFNVGKAKKVDLLGRVVELVEIKGEYIVPGGGKVSYTNYVDRDFKTQKMIIPMAGINIVMISCPEAFARSNLESADLVSSMILKSPIVIHNVEKTKEIVYTLKPKNPDTHLHFPVTDSQQVDIRKDGTVVVTVRPPAGDSNAVFPYRGNDPKILRYLKSTPYIQSDNPVIIKLARECIKDKKYALDAAIAIEAFVGRYIEKKDLSVGYASALEVARSREGDCTEHAVLTAAICRAAGIPSRIVTGIAYVKKFLNMTNCFGGHEWTEAYIGDKWIDLDATFSAPGRRGFDAGHIAMATGNGNPGDFFSMAGTLGSFEIEKVKIVK